MSQIEERVTGSEWIKRIDEALLQLDEKPQFPQISHFPFTTLADQLGQLFQEPKLTLHHQGGGWKRGEELFNGFGADLIPLAIEWTPLSTPLYFLINSMTIKELMSDLLGGEETAAPFFDQDLSEGFLHTLAAFCLRKLSQEGYLNPLAPRLASSPLEIREILRETPCFVHDISCGVKERTAWGRLLVPEAFRSELKSEFASLPPPPIDDQEAEKLPLQIAVEVGRSSFSLEEWQAFKKGDFLLLDRCSYNPDEQKGSAILKLGKSPLFRGRFKEGKLNISEYPHTDEVDESMEIEEGQEIPEILKGGEEGHELEELPMQLTVEAGRLQLTLKELRQLAPGNTLELGSTPEQGVDLLVNGKRVGRGELIRMGETLGVRILTL